MSNHIDNNWELLLIGEGDQLEYLKELSKKLGINKK